MFITKWFHSNLLALLLLVVITFPAYQALLKPGVITGHDTQGHIIRLYEFDQALKDGHFPVRWSKRLNEGLGYPFFNFNYPLNYYLAEVFSYITGSYNEAFKVLFLLSFPLSAWTAFLWLKKHFSKYSAFVGGLFYTFIPYHFVNVYVRGNIGELVALTVVPLIFLTVDNLIHKPSLRRVVLLSLTTSALILSHNVMAMIFIPVVGLYFLLKAQQDLKLYKPFIVAMILALTLTAFFWLPALMDKSAVAIDSKYLEYKFKHFPEWKDLIYSPWGFGGSNVGRANGQMSVQIGLLHQLIVLGSLLILCYQIIVKRGFDHQVKVGFLFVGLMIAALFIMQPISIPIWNLIKPLEYLQFPWRLLAVLMVSISFLAAYFYDRIFNISWLAKGKMLVLIITLAGLLFFNRNHWQVNEYYQMPDYWFTDNAFSGTTTPDAESRPVWQSTELSKEDLHFQVVEGQANVIRTIWKTNHHQFITESTTGALIADRTVYFPGWEVEIDHQPVKILDPYDSRAKGLITFQLPAGSHQVDIRLKEPLHHQIANGFSLISILIVSGVLLRKTTDEKV